MTDKPTQNFFLERIEIYFKRRQCLVKNKKEYYVFTDPEMKRFEYYIPKMKTEHELLCWILHMSEKTWVTREHIEMFILRFMEDNDKNYYL